MLGPKRVIYSITFFVLAMGLLIVSKPSYMFDDRGKLRPFGVSDHESTFASMGLIAIVLSIVVFYLFSMIDLFG